MDHLVLTDTNRNFGESDSDVVECSDQQRKRKKRKHKHHKHKREKLTNKDDEKGNKVERLMQLIKFSLRNFH